MAAVVGFLVVATVCVVVTLLVAGPVRVVRRDPTFELKDVASRHVTVLGALAGFAVTAIIFLVTQSRTLDDRSGDAFTTVLVMFVVAYMGYWSSTVLYANVSQPEPDPVFDLAAAQYAGAAITLMSLLLGWFALKPLFETFGLDRVASITGWLLAGAVVVSYLFMAAALSRSGYASARQLAVIALATVVGVGAYAAVVGLVAPGARSPDATLALTVTAFVLGIASYGAMTLLPVAARDERLNAVLARRWHLAILAYAQSVTVLVAFLLLAVHGLA
jgi:hypothetical protein